MAPTLDPEKLHKAICLAFQSRDRAYAPYSHFRVGSTLITDDGSLVGGCNVENASYGAGVCAERTAASKAISEGHKSFTAVVVVSDVSSPSTSPCGICRQVLREFCALEAPIYMVADGYPTEGGVPAWIQPGTSNPWPQVTDDKMAVVRTLDELLPMSFGPDHLGRKSL